MIPALEPDELRGSRPVLGGAEGEIPSAYSPSIIAPVWESFVRHFSASSGLFKAS